MSDENRVEPRIGDAPIAVAPVAQRRRFENVRENRKVPIAPRERNWKPLKWLLWLLILVLLSGLIYQEARTSYVQSRVWHFIADTLHFELGAGPAPEEEHPIFPTAGPFDERAGYRYLADWLPQLSQSGFSIQQQTRFSPALQQFAEWGFYPPYAEKTQWGLQIVDCKQESLFSFSTPEQQFAQFNDIAPLMLRTLLFIENRDLFQHAPLTNPALDWSRLGAAVLGQVQKMLGQEASAAGGSTLATQIEKYRHSPQGLTAGFADKFKQMVSASIRAYQPGLETLERRKQIALDYINTVPLAATPHTGEVHGIADGLAAWFGTDAKRVNQLLQDSTPTAEHGQALRQVLALFIAQRRPSFYLLQGKAELEQLVASHLRLLRQFGIINTAWYDEAAAQTLQFRTQSRQAPRKLDKTALLVRNRVAALLNRSLYQTDRLDLQVQTTLNLPLQEKINRYLNQLALLPQATQAGIIGPRLLREDQIKGVKYSFTLYESTPTGNKLRVQTDNHAEQPFDLNEGGKLELGSTAKLRMLTTYLEMIAEIHQTYAEESAAQLALLDIAPQDSLSQWAINYLIANPRVNLTTMLNAALDREFSADPRTSFFTGGGLHTFGNFRREEDQMNPTLRQSLYESINLPFVRVTQEIVQYSIHHGETSSYQLLKNDDDPRRDQYLRRFADHEGVSFLQRFWRKYHKLNADQRLEVFLNGLRQTPDRLSAGYRFINPSQNESDFVQFMQQRFTDNPLTAAQWRQLYQKYSPSEFSLPDQAYLARSHPLELWLLAYLEQQPTPTLADAISLSAEVRQQAYQWLFRTQSRSARDNRIRTMLEIEAFWDIHQRWQRLGYPFDYLVPSLATALGSSGDRPAALAELLGIIQNGGRRLPMFRVEGLHFAANTPYAAQLARTDVQIERVMAPEVAQVLRENLGGVVQQGTGRRLLTQYSLPNLPDLALIGGKTGTGDNRISTVNSRGETVQSRALNRTATFAFYFSDKYFGVISVYLPGNAAADYFFTSALPLQVLNGMSPLIMPLLKQQDSCPQ
ncbi:transglycosylase domain-containing protein [Alishewanella tabrizica]|uniref:peptidoglycan glycosyltransferase n=1 Tax=Alishewanella tabrizica TaxID=671278 RepID=A0ABQ2WBU6_9ALTE|nr:transglycosylase domain-containing protein [Alishewanella tabrizica]GGW48964.1 glycosyl transferase [Alishewanella tabrizica]